MCALSEFKRILNRAEGTDARVDRGRCDGVVEVGGLSGLHRDRNGDLEREFPAVGIGLDLVSLRGDGREHEGVAPCRGPAAHLLGEVEV